VRRRFAETSSPATAKIIARQQQQQLFALLEQHVGPKSYTNPDPENDRYQRYGAAQVPAYRLACHYPEQQPSLFAHRTEPQLQGKGEQPAALSGLWPHQPDDDGVRGSQDDSGGEQHGRHRVHGAVERG
jgi:hypothetical protein